MANLKDFAAAWPERAEMYFAIAKAALGRVGVDIDAATVVRVPHHDGYVAIEVAGRDAAGKEYVWAERIAGGAKQ